MQSTRSSSLFVNILVWLVLASAAFGTYLVVSGLNASSEIYLQVQSELQKPVYSGSVGTIDLNKDGDAMNIPTYELFQSSDLWALVSKTSPLPATYVPGTLTDPDVPRGGSEVMKVDVRINARLTQLVDAAAADGINLVLSSAYRSIADQEKLLAQFTREEGAAAAAKYVAAPGSSEHHTGMSVDFAIDSDPCREDSDSCSLGVAAAVWLKDNAYKYGFIQRYPEGAEDITHIAHEPWHYRYVGIVLARELRGSGMTFDEFYDQAR